MKFMPYRLLPRLTLSAICLLLTLGGGLRAEEFNLPELGSPSDQYLTPSEEARLGREFMLSIRKNAKVIDDPLIEEYIQDLGNHLLKQSDATGQDFTFFVLENPDINAFAGYGGHIGIYSGLILATQTESELASVIAHEIAHVSQKHLLRAFDAASRISGKTAALLLASILIGMSGSADAGLAIATGAQASALQEEINFTRGNEEEADTMGIRILADANFDPRAMPVFFERLTHANRLYETGAPEMLRTHPVTSNRIADALGRAEQHGYRQYPSSLHFYLTREALRVRQFKEPAEAIKHFSSGLTEGRHLNEEAHKYGYALALIRNKEYAKARQIIDNLLKGNGAQIEYILASAKLSELRDHRAEGLHTLKSYYVLMPENYPLSVAYIEALGQAGDYDKARQVAARAISLRSDNPRLYRLVGRIEELAGNQSESHRMLAEAYVVDGQLHAAMQQLEIALRNADKDDFQQVSRIESRLARLREVVKWQEKEKSQH